MGFLTELNYFRDADAMRKKQQAAEQKKQEASAVQGASGGK